MIKEFIFSALMLHKFLRKKLHDGIFKCNFN